VKESEARLGSDLLIGPAVVEVAVLREMRWDERGETAYGFTASSWWLSRTALTSWPTPHQLYSRITNIAPGTVSDNRENLWNLLEVR
jgi:hypothetical protein